MPSCSDDAELSPAIRTLQRGLSPRAGSLLITVFGDAIAPRQQSVWLGSLIALLGLFNISPRLVRTSAFRLCADDWFEARPIGRRSYYGLSEIGMRRVQHADRRIYEFNLPQWDGHWTLVILDASMRASDRQHLQRELLWESFGKLSSHVFAHPHVNHDSLAEILKATGTQGQAAVLRAASVPNYGGQPLQTIMHDTFALTRVADAWMQFIQRFAFLLEELVEPTPAQAFVARTLLIHEYRRVLLRDPNLPRAFLPADWPGVKARQLCESLYGQLLKPSESYLRAQVQTPDGMLAQTPRAITRRLERPLQAT